MHQHCCSTFWPSATYTSGHLAKRPTVNNNNNNIKWSHQYFNATGSSCAHLTLIFDHHQPFARFPYQCPVPICICGEQACRSWLLALASHRLGPSLNLARSQMWIEFVGGARLVLRVFSGFSSFSPFSKLTPLNSKSIWYLRATGLSVGRLTRGHPC